MYTISYPGTVWHLACATMDNRVLHNDASFCICDDSVRLECCPHAADLLITAPAGDVFVSRRYTCPKV